VPRRWATTSTSSPTLAQAPQPLSRPPPAAGRAWRRGMAGAGWRAREGGLGGRGAEWWLRRRATVGGGRSSKRPRALRLPPVLLPVSRTPVARVHKRSRFTVRHKLGRVAPPSISKQGPCLPPQCRGTASHRGSTFPTAPTSPSITSREPQLQLRQQTCAAALTRRRGCAPPARWPAMALGELLTCASPSARALFSSYGVFSTEGSAPRCGVAIGDSVLDLAAGPRARTRAHLGSAAHRARG